MAGSAPSAPPMPAPPFPSSAPGHEPPSPFRQRMEAAVTRLAALPWRKWAERTAIALGALSFAGALALWLVVRHYEAGLPSVSDLRAYQAPQVTRVLARDGTVLAELFTQRRTVVPIATLPAHVKLAVLAAEDAGFYEHQGLNYLGIARAMLVNLRKHGTRQGGSTITQQVVKNLLLNTRERTISRKIREALLARRLEQDLTKDEILELYVNNIYLGRGRYGIEEAARDDFGRSAKDLDHRPGRAHRRAHREPARLPPAGEPPAGAGAAGVRARADAREGLPHGRAVVGGGPRAGRARAPRGERE